MNNKKCILLLSGGIDSVTLLAKLVKDNYKIFALSFIYGQNHEIEIDYAKQQANKYGVIEHLIIQIDKNIFGNNKLVSNQAIEYTSIENLPNKISEEYLPARNIIFLSYALSWAEQIRARKIFIAANKDDYNKFPDCRGQFYKSFEQTANISGLFNESEEKVKILSPFEDLTKVEIIKLGIELKVDYSKTISCYFPNKNKPCGKCMSCLIRINALNMNGIKE